jgi:ATP-dependent helicase HrpA
MTHADEEARRLPIYACEQAILQALRTHQVIVVEGPTGCGKTTQIPRIVQHHLGIRRIGVTQPRRLAAVSVAWRIAAEEGVTVGSAVGYAIRFDDKTSPQTVIKLMTDGILLMEARGDGDLSAYDVLMIDEAHERSLNIDVILGLTHQLVARRKDLRVIISSATMYPAQFQRFFAPVAPQVPVISIPSRTYPIDITYHPLGAGRATDRADLVVSEILDIHHHKPPGHILVFLSGEGDIRRVETTLQESPAGRDLVVLPLFGRLTREEQERVFDDVGTRRKVVLATNIAETSITIRDVRYVVDSGLAKIPSFSPRSGITALREMPISRASAQQRAGRAGRTGPGEVVRLYEEDSLAQRPEFTSEEILRVDLSEVVLRLIDLGLFDVESFPFPTPPPPGKVQAALAALEAMGAIQSDRRLTPIGRRMVPFPLSPSLARMVIEAAQRFPRVVDDVLIAGAFLSSRAPFVTPEPEVDAARRAHRRFSHPLGDVVTLVKVYRAWKQSRQPKEFCEKSFLDPEVMAFVAHAHQQLADIAREQGIEPVGGGPEDELVQAVATGLADRVMRRREESNDYETWSGTRVSLHPSSVLMGKAPLFAVAAELVEYTRAYAFQVSVLRREWLPHISPRAATRFGVHTGARSAASRPAAAAPTHLQLGSLTLEIPHGRGRPTVELGLEQLPALMSLRTEDLPPEASRVRAAVRWVKPYVFAALPVAKLLSVVRVGRFPAFGEEPPRALVFGLLLESDRDRHRIEAALPWVLRPAVTGRSAGWVALVANGAGGYWLDLVPYFHDAVRASLLSADTLADELYEGDTLRDAARTIVAAMRELESKLA